MDPQPTPDRPEFRPLTELEFEPTSCPVCGATGVTKPFEKDFQGHRLRFATCTSCGTLYQNPRMTVDSLRTIYDSEEFFEGREKNVNYYSFLSGETYLRRTARGRIERFRPWVPGNRLLEVASAAGFFLAEAKAAGFDAEGVEFSNPMARYAADRWGVPVTAGSIEEVDLDPATYDVIASWGVMTILRDPKAVMAKFHAALKPGGVWAFNTYSRNSLWGRLFGRRWYILVANTSQIHDDETLLRLLDEAGFDVVARTRDRPYASIERLLFVLLSHVSHGVRDAFFKRIHVLNRMVLPVRAPDTYEYVCVKR
ncbi:class I SAM-dependent methyltransferase [Nocardioides guangzhouensis]|uniref:Class I SAM-dependent methyltransferase n=1 Tax=Nocardioides guangzhouensis TaxID=2497878 RepID=A0A4Q4ZIG8_9ACTN|nr:class I SAM-dependent methyltransferase [Nocardioides guangzhouensis]RYP88013.1 class I SAM-dependent methyltransferase [Nocardioides guangzhouensis]